MADHHLHNILINIRTKKNTIVEDKYNYVKMADHHLHNILINIKTKTKYYHLVNILINIKTKTKYHHLVNTLINARLKTNTIVEDKYNYVKMADHHLHNILINIGSNTNTRKHINIRSKTKYYHLVNILINTRSNAITDHQLINTRLKKNTQRHRDESSKKQSLCFYASFTQAHCTWRMAQG